MTPTPTGRPPTVRRKDAFFGLHFDLHPQETDTVLGADITEENLGKLLARARPDYVQYDCKGHAGYTGYPTKVGWASPGIVRDSLALWRKVTREYGAGLFIHYSGVWDSVAIEHHPEWARVDAEGNRDANATSTFGPYVDELLIPQLVEACELYDLDGAWVDGECWATQLDYSPAALEAWRKATGYPEAPKSRDEPHWLEWKTFHRRRFEEYLCHWVDAVHRRHRRFQVTSNWAYTTLMPLPVGARLDYLSGDYSPTVSLDRGRVDARYLASAGMPWDLLAWGFNWYPGYGHSLKLALHLQQEAAATLMQGGAFGIYYTPTRAGYIVDEIIETSGQVADFCRARQAVCHKSTTVPQVALLLSSETQLDRSDAVFHWGGCLDELEGALHALLELHYSVDILAEHQLQPRLNEFPLVVVPDSYRLADDFRQALLSYVEQGGSLLLLGEQCARLFAGDLGVTFGGQPEPVTAELSSAAGIVNADGVWQKVTPTMAEAVGRRYPTRDTRKDGEVAATVVARGQGKIGAVYGPVALAYYRMHHPSLRGFIGDIVTRLFPEPAVTVDAPPCVEVALRRTAKGKLSLHLLNCAEVQRADRFLSTEYIPEVGPIEVRMSVADQPQRVRWAPDGGRLKWSWVEGILSVTVPKLHIHGVVVVG